MERTVSSDVRKLGLWSAWLTTVFSVFYVLAQFAEWFGWLGSGGGPESASTAAGLGILLTPSLLLGSSFVVLMISIHHYAPESRKIWSHVGLVFAGIYATLTGMVYFIQLTFVAPHISHHDIDGIRLLLFTPFDSFLYSVDLLGYSFMSLATLFAAFVFTGKGLEKAVRWFLIANGLLIPFLLFQIYYHPLIWGGALWGATFPGCTISLILLFSRKS